MSMVRDIYATDDDKPGQLHTTFLQMGTNLYYVRIDGCWVGEVYWHAAGNHWVFHLQPSVTDILPTPVVVAIGELMTGLPNPK